MCSGSDGSASTWSLKNIILWFDGVNTKLGLWAQDDYISTTHGFSCYGATIYLPTGHIVSPVTNLMSVQ